METNVQLNSESLAERALVIDDLRAARVVLVDLLSDLGVKDCIQASGGKEALNILKSESVGIIFCDFMMYGMDGPQFLTELRQLDLPNTPPVIFVSSLDDLESIKEVVNLGASNYIVKPIDSKELRTVVEKTLAGQASGK
jgi:two-component system chemotaxis response regulator CheY